MKDFATTARDILDKLINFYATPEYPSLKPDDALAQLVAAHEADKREAVRGELNKQLAVTFRELADEHDYDYGEDWVLGGKADYYEAQAALDTPPNGSEKPTTPPTTPLGDNAAGGHTNSRKDKP